jgi:hypothetical protein
MRLKLAFTRGPAGVLRVHAVPLYESSKTGRGGRHFLASYANEGVFLSLLEQADIDPIHAHIVESVGTLALSPGTLVYCDDVSLDERQLLILLNGAIRRRTA